MGEIGAVDDDEDVGIGRHDGFHGLPNSMKNRRQAIDDGRETHDGDILQPEQARQPLLRHRMAADTAEPQALRAVPRLERPHQLGPELIA